MPPPAPNKPPTTSRYTLLTSLLASTGTLLFGFDTGIATTTIAHPSFQSYMSHPSPALTGAVVAVYISGEAVGALCQTFFSDKFPGRKPFMQTCCVLVTLGTTIQTASTSMAMFLAGRALAGVAVGALVGTVPVYVSEIAAEGDRGLVAGIGGCGISFGTMLANWVGYACGVGFDGGQKQWRVPLGLQIPWGVGLFLGLWGVMPESPRVLLWRGEVERARVEFEKVRGDLRGEGEREVEFERMGAQIAFEVGREVKSYREVWRLFRRRVLVSVAVQTMTSLTGVNVIQYYQVILYKSLGISPTTILALAGIYGTIAFVANCLTTRYLTDQWGRRKMILTGLSGIILVEIYAAVMQWKFQDTNNRVGKGFAVLGIYLFVVVYYGMLNSTTWLYGAEVLPIALRSKVMGLAAASHFIVNVGVTEAGPAAFAKIGQNYYYVFVACTLFFLTVAYLYFPETRRKSLEEIAAAFGDKVVDLEETPVTSSDDTLGGKGASAHIEESNNGVLDRS